MNEQNEEILRLKKKVVELETELQLDRAEIIRLRRWIEAQAEAADVRPVVLCRDCTYCRKGKASLECEKHTYAWNNTSRWVDEDDFCSWGVKREQS
jgi:hypothetical protein